MDALNRPGGLDQHYYAEDCESCGGYDGDCDDDCGCGDCETAREYAADGLTVPEEER